MNDPHLPPIASPTDAGCELPGRSAPEHVMQCMEVWGGSHPVDNAVSMPGLDAWIYSRPFANADEGGDVHYVSSCATGRITRLLVADVAGHGAGVRELAVGLRSLMRRFVNYIDQSRFVRSMNEQFAAMSKNGLFATALVTTFYAPTNRLRVCNAGHPPPLRYRVATGTWESLELKRSADPASAESADPMNLPLGILDLADYDQFDVDLAVGDIVLCYTDALPEAHDLDGGMLGQAGLMKTVSETPLQPAETFVPRLLEKIGGLWKGNLDSDDVTALLFRPNGSAPDKPLKERLMVPFRVAREIVRSFGRKDEPAPWPEPSVAALGGAMMPGLSKVGQGTNEP